MDARNHPKPLGIARAHLADVKRWYVYIEEEDLPDDIA